jgi:hypothetical protein
LPVEAPLNEREEKPIQKEVFTLAKEAVCSYLAGGISLFIIFSGSSLSVCTGISTAICKARDEKDQRLHLYRNSVYDKSVITKRVLRILEQELSLFLNIS